VVVPRWEKTMAYSAIDDLAKFCSRSDIHPFLKGTVSYLVITSGISSSWVKEFFALIGNTRVPGQCAEKLPKLFQRFVAYIGDLPEKYPLFTSESDFHDFLLHFGECDLFNMGRAFTEEIVTSMITSRIDPTLDEDDDDRDAAYGAAEKVFAQELGQVILCLLRSG
jgi:hypothetical protein